MNQKSDDEVGLLDFFDIVWDGKKTIFSFVSVVLIIATTYIYFKEPVYESKIFYQADTLPPFHTGKPKLWKDFQKLYYNESLFNTWKNNSKSSLLVFKDFSSTQAIDGVVLSKHEDNRTAILDENKKEGPFILIRSKELTLVDDFYKYGSYINEMLTKEYILRSKDEINIIYKRFNDPSATTDTLTGDLLSIDRYIVEAEKGDRALIISRPTVPVLAKPRINLIITVSFLLGLFLGLVYIFFSDAIRIRKEQLANTKESQ
tara:strand:+ start:606 stop:1385 length:780 start_codon:yes stop_codon:yes gene_type:complete